MELDERKSKILKAIIQTYLENRRAGWLQNHFQIYRFESQLCDDPK